MAVPQTTEYITLHEAMAIAGPEVVVGWTGEEMSTKLWKPGGDEAIALVKERWREIAAWFCDELSAKTLVFYVRTGKGMSAVMVETFKGREPGPFFITGRLTKLPRQKAIASQLADASSRERPLWVDRAELRKRINHHLRPDDRESWTFIEVFAWIIWQRHDMVRNYQIPAQCYEFLSGDIGQTGDKQLIQAKENALADLWGKLGRNEIVATACPVSSDGRRIPVPAIEWQDYRIETRDGLDVLVSKHSGAPVYHTPVLARIEVLNLWGGQSADTTSRKRLKGHDRSRLKVHAEAAYKLELATNPQSMRSELSDWEFFKTKFGRNFPRSLAVKIRQGLNPKLKKSGAPPKTKPVQIKSG